MGVQFNIEGELDDDAISFTYSNAGRVLSMALGIQGPRNDPEWFHNNHKLDPKEVDGENALYQAKMMDELDPDPYAGHPLMNGDMNIHQRRMKSVLTLCIEASSKGKIIHYG